MTTCAACGTAIPQDARFCPACGAEQEPSAAVAEERKLATVLFADLVSSTARAHGEDPERVRARLDRFYDAMARRSSAPAARSRSSPGDSVMAAFGAPAALEDHAERALHAALAMQRRLEELFGDELQLRIGVNTGDVVVGRPRKASSFVTGDAVNVAARLEQAAAPGEVLAGERTVAAARGAFEFGDPRVVEAKGKPDGVVGRPVAPRADTDATAGCRRVSAVSSSAARASSSCCGRPSGAPLRSGEPHLVTIVGEPGVGKTTLDARVLGVLAEEEPAPLRRTGRCLPVRRRDHLLAAGRGREGAFRNPRERPGRTRSSATARATRDPRACARAGRRRWTPSARCARASARSRRRASSTSSRPSGRLVMLVEDIHWAEDDLLDLLERVVRDARGPVSCSRPRGPELLDTAPGWGGGRGTRRRSGSSRCRAEARRACSTSCSRSSCRRSSASSSSSGPRAIRSSSRSSSARLSTRACSSGRNGAWSSRRAPRGLLRARHACTRFSPRASTGFRPTEKAALQAAAVVGRVFWPRPVVHLLGGGEPDFDLLEERDFIRRRGGSSMAGEREYAIKHALTREVAYASIPKARRGPAPCALADWLERRIAGKDEHASLLAYHYAEAVRPEDADLVWAGDEEEHARLRSTAVTWLRRAGELARGRYEIDEAVELLTRAVELADDAHERALSGARSAGPRRSASTARRSGRRCIARSRARSTMRNGRCLRVACLPDLDPLGHVGRRR